MAARPGSRASLPRFVRRLDDECLARVGVGSFLWSVSRVGLSTSKGAAHDIDEGLTLDCELTNFIDDQHFAFIPGVFNRRNRNALERFDVDAVAEDP